MDWLGDHLTLAWVAVAILLAITELASLDLILLMLALGALVGALTALVGGPVVLQAILAVIASVGTLGFLRPQLIKRLHSGPELRLGHDKLVGQRALVTQKITGLSPGQIALGGETWTASPYDESLTIQPGENVEVLQIRGATAYVHPVPSIES
jgi:membrane protein implicated in regulation of membrane protease activity